MKNKYFVVITGVLLSVAFPPMIFNNLVFIAFLPLLQVLDTYLNNRLMYGNYNGSVTYNKNTSLFFPLYLTFIVYHIGANWWIGSFQKQTDPYLLMSAVLLSIFHPFFFMFPIYMFMKFYNKFQGQKELQQQGDNQVRGSNGINKLFYFFPLFWVGFEWLHGETELSYPWLTVGYTQITHTSWIQFIDITGIWGASAVILFINVLIFDILTILAKTTRSENQVSKDVKEKRNNVKFLLNFIDSQKNRISALFLFFLLPFIYSLYQKSEFEKIVNQTITLNSDKVAEKTALPTGSNENNFVKIAVIQPNINPWEKWKRNGEEQINLHLKIQDSLRESFVKNFKRPVDLFLWSETAIPYINIVHNVYKNIPEVYDDIYEHNYSLLTGFTDIHLYKDSNDRGVTSKLFDRGMYYDSYNSAFIINKKDILTGFSRGNFQENLYYKMKLTPFAERLPHVEYFNFAKTWFEWGVGISSWGKGVDQKVLKFEGNGKTANIAPIICIESIYPRFVSNFSSLGADIFVVITNDAWYNGTPGPRQHFLLAAARAIENKKFLVRSANSGVSGVISPLGNSLIELPTQEVAAFAYSVPKLANITFYSKYKDWLPVSMLLVILIFIVQRQLISEKQNIKNNY